MKLTLGFSPCPNDTFIFDALVHHKVDTEGLEFDYHMADVEQLNLEALSGATDITKVSFNAFLSLAGTYLLLDSGAALGFGTGPLLIAKNEMKPAELEDCLVALPGLHTTASLLFSIAFPAHSNKKMMLFSDIENAVLAGTADAGVIIHENRFTYEAKGLKKVMDLGAHWEQLSASPVPLGGIVAHKRLGYEIIAKAERSIRRSIEFANRDRNLLPEFITCHAAEMDETVMRRHIDLYVNEYSVSLGETGRKAVLQLFETALKAGLIAAVPEKIFA